MKIILLLDALYTNGTVFKILMDIFFIKFNIRYPRMFSRFMSNNGISYILEIISKVLFNPWLTKKRIAKLWNRKYQLILE